MKTPQVLRTKFSIPVIKKSILKRNRLLQLLKDNSNKKVCFITGGAGYGKTTLVSQYLKEVKCPFLFYHIDEEDNNPFLFLWSFVAGIEQIIQKGFGRGAKELLKLHSQSRFPLQVLKIIINDFIKIRKSLLIVFDDYHNIEEKSETHKIVDYLLTHSQDKVHFLFLSRNKPSLPSFSRLKLAGDCIEIREKDLCFTREEVKKIVKKVKNVSLQKPEYELLLEYTEGWITGIQIILQFLGDRPLIEIIKQYHISGKEIFDYFINEVFNHESKTIREFLIHSSIFDEIKEKICREVLGLKDAFKILRYLEEKHLFISCIDPVKGCYRYHPLFREFLIKKISKDVANSLYKKVGKYFLNIGNLTNAFKYFMKGENYKEAENLIKEESHEILRNIPLGLIQNYLAKIPESRLKEFPYFLLVKAQNLLLNEKIDKAEKLLLLGKSIFKDSDDIRGLHNVEDLMIWLLTNKRRYKKALQLAHTLLKEVQKDSTIRCGIMNRIAGIYFEETDYRKAQEYLENALSTIRDKGFYETECSLQTNLAVLKCRQGDYNEAYKELVAIYEKYRFHFPFRLAVSCINLILLEIKMGKLTDAQIHTEWLISTAQKYQMDYFHIRGIALQGLIESYFGHKQKSKKIFKKALQLSKRHSPDFAFYVYEIMFQHCLHHRKIDEADKIFTILEQGKKPIDLLPLYVGKLYYEKGELQKALDYFTKAVNKAKEIKDKFYEADALLWLAKTLWLINKKEEAKQFLLLSLRIAKKKGYDFLYKREYKDSKKFFSSYPELKEFSDILGVKKLSVITEEEKILPRDVKICFFGSFRLFINDKELIIPWHSEKVQSVFAYLCARSGKHSIDRLLEEFWPERNPEKSRNILYAAFSYIRKYFKPYFQEDIIKRHLHTYFLNPAFTFYKDTEDFEQSLRQGLSLQNEGKNEESIRRYEYARGLYKGDFLANLYDTWVEEEIEYYRRKFFQLLKNLGNLYKKIEELNEALKVYEYLINKNPYEEENYFILAEIFSQMKQKKKIVELAKRYEQAMLELSITPDPSIKNRFNKFLP